MVRVDPAWEEEGQGKPVPWMAVSRILQNSSGALTCCGLQDTQDMLGERYVVSLLDRAGIEWPVMSQLALPPLFKLS